jgi:hypothetical protein
MTTAMATCYGRGHSQTITVKECNNISDPVGLGKICLPVQEVGAVMRTQGVAKADCNVAHNIPIDTPERFPSMIFDGG